MIRHMRRSLKKFLCLPIHTSHQTLNQAFLDLEMYTTHHAAKISKRTSPLVCIRATQARSPRKITLPHYPNTTENLRLEMQHINNVNHLTAVHQLPGVRVLLTTPRPYNKEVLKSLTDLYQKLQKLQPKPNSFD